MDWDRPTAEEMEVFPSLGYLWQPETCKIQESVNQSSFSQGSLTLEEAGSCHHTAEKMEAFPSLPVDYLWQPESCKIRASVKSIVFFARIPYVRGGGKLSSFD